MGNSHNQCNLGCTFGWPYIIEKKSSIGNFDLTLWKHDQGNGHALIVYSEKSRQHSILITSSTPTNEINEVISSVEVDDLFYFSGSRSNGIWDSWMYQPDCDKMYVYKSGDGHPNEIFEDSNCFLRVEGEYLLLKDTTNGMHYVEHAGELIGVSADDYIY